VVLLIYITAHGLAGSVLFFVPVYIVKISTVFQLLMGLRSFQKSGF
jgi:hypothetical protein